MVVTLTPQVYAPLWASLTCFSSNDMLYSLTVFLKVLVPRAFWKCVVFWSRPLKSQNVQTSSASVSVTSQWRVIVLPSSKVMFCCVVVTFSTSRRKRKMFSTAFISGQGSCFTIVKKGLHWRVDSKAKLRSTTAELTLTSHVLLFLVLSSLAPFFLGSETLFATASSSRSFSSYEHLNNEY